MSQTNLEKNNAYIPSEVWNNEKKKNKYFNLLEITFEQFEERYFPVVVHVGHEKWRCENCFNDEIQHWRRCGDPEFCEHDPYCIRYGCKTSECAGHGYATRRREILTMEEHVYEDDDEPSKPF